MASYIPQYMFNMCAVTAAKIAVANELSFEDAAKRLSDNYRKSYDDSNLHGDIVSASELIVEFIESEFPDSPLVANLTQIQFSIVNFEPDGRERKKRLFGGTWFNKERKQIIDKVSQCKSNIMTYHMLLVGGALPLAPPGWSL